MKRGIIMEVNRRTAVVLTKDGSFEQIRLKKGQYAAVGEEILIPKNPEKRRLPVFLPSFSAAAAAMIVFVLFMSGILPFGNQEAAVAAYVSVDINPSIEVGVNDELEVLEVHALNSEGTRVIGDVNDYEQMSLEDFVRLVIERSEQKGYLVQNHDVLLTATVVTDDKKDASVLSGKLEKTMATVQKDKPDDALNITVLEGDETVREKAQKVGVSTGKYIVYLDALEKGKPLSIEQIKQMSVTQIHDAVEAPYNEDNKSMKASDKQNQSSQKSSNQATKENGKSNDTPKQQGNKPSALPQKGEDKVKATIEEAKKNTDKVIGNVEKKPNDPQSDPVKQNDRQNEKQNNKNKDKEKDKEKDDKDKEKKDKDNGDKSVSNPIQVEVGIINRDKDDDDDDDNDEQHGNESIIRIELPVIGDLIRIPIK